MFNVKQWIANLNIADAMFVLLAFIMPLQTRILFNPSESYIDYYFSYHLGIWLYFSDILFIAFIMSWMLFNRSTNNKFWLLLALFAGLTPLFHVEQIPSYLYSMAKSVQFLLIVIYGASRTNLKTAITYTLLASGLIQAIIGIGQFHAQGSIGLELLGEYVPKATDLGAATFDYLGTKVLRAYGTLPHPNVFGGYMAILLLLSVYVSRETQLKYLKYIVSCGTLVLFTAMTLSFSRSAWLGAILGLSIMFIHDFWRYKRKNLLLWGLLIVSCGTIIAGYWQYIAPRASERASTSPAQTYRAEFNDYGLEIASNEPIFGVGLGQYVPYLVSHYSLEPWQNQPPHNIAILIYAEVGFVGVLILLLGVRLQRFTWNTTVASDSVLILSLVACILVLGFLDHYLYTIQQTRLLVAVIISTFLLKQKMFHIM